MDMTKSAAMNNVMPTTAESGTTSTTSLVQWTALPVLHSRAQPCPGEPGVDDQLDEQDAKALRLHAERIVELWVSTNRTMTKAIIDIGGELCDARALLAGKGREGRFRPWCKRQGFSKSSVYRAIAAHEAFGKCPTVGHFFDPQAVYLLSAGSCPEAARAEAMRLAEQGKHVDHDLAKQIVAKFVPKTTTTSKRRTRQLDVEVEQASKITTEIKQLEHQPGEVEKPTGKVEATTSSSGIASAGETATSAADPPVSTDDSAIATVGTERQTGLAGLQAVIVALEQMGVYDEYRDTLDRIRVALEGLVGQEEENEEAGEWKF